MRLLAPRLVRLAVVILVVSFFSFILLDAAPGDRAVQKAGVNATPEVIEQIREELGLNGNLAARYGRWVGDAARGDLGDSLVSGRSTVSLIRTALPKTIELLVLAQVMALAVSIPAAIYSARHQGGLVDRATSAVAFGLLALPAFVLGIYLSFLFAVKWGLLPAVATDIPGLNDDPVENLRQMFLPSLTLATGLVAAYLRLLRSDLLDTLQQDFVLLARARGFSERRVMWRYAFRPASLSLLTAVGLNTGGLIGGALVVELLFAVPGMGRLAIGAIFAEDYVVLQGAVLLFSVGFVMVNFVVDLLYAIVDPRIRHGAR